MVTIGGNRDQAEGSNQCGGHTMVQIAEDQIYAGLEKSSNLMTVMHTIKHEVALQNEHRNSSGSDIHISCMLDRGPCPASDDLQLPSTKVIALRAQPVDKQISSPMKRTVVACIMRAEA